MKYIGCFLFVLLSLFSNFSSAQNQIITFTYDKKSDEVTYKPNGDYIKKFNLKSTIEVKYKNCTNPKLNVKYKDGGDDKDEPIKVNKNSFRINTLSDNKLSRISNYRIEFNCDQSSAPITLEINTPAKNVNRTFSRESSEEWLKHSSYQNDLDKSPQSEHDAKEFHLFFNERGEALKKLPVNVDRNGVFKIRLVVAKEDKNKYSINVAEGEYNAEDLLFRNYDKISDEFKVFGDGEDKPYEWTVIEREYGPFTTDNFIFRINYAEEEDNIRTLATHKIKINKLFHIDVGVSFISTDLSKPNFDLFPLNDTINTIIALDEGQRTMLTFNVIWYWPLSFKKGISESTKESYLTRGRDVLKEEPFFSLRRLFPTFGVSLDKNYNNNFFIGGVYEFARGGSLIFGGHYGQTQSLADKNFELGTTHFNGTKEDIILNKKWNWGFFFGITVDTRIFNALMKR